MAKELQDPEAERVGGGLGTGNQEGRDQREDLVGLKVVAFGLHLNEVRHQVVGRLASLFLHPLLDFREVAPH